MPVRGSRIGAVTVLGLALGLGLPGQASAEETTKIRLQVRGCEGCVFIAHNGKRPAKAWNKAAVSSEVRNGKAVMVVPTRITPWMSLEVQHPRNYSSGNAVPFVAFDWLRASYGMTGEICWNTVAGPSERLSIVVSKFRGRPVPGVPKETMIRARLAQLPDKAMAGVNGTPICS